MVLLNTAHTPSERSRLIQELRDEITEDQNKIRLEDPKLKALEREVAKDKPELAKKEAQLQQLKKLEQEIIKDRNELAKKEAEAQHSREELQKVKAELIHDEQVFNQIQRDIRDMHIGRN